MPDTDVYVSAGSNIAPEENIPAALVAVARHVEVVAVSTFYRTAPLGRPEQPHFLNGVVQVRSSHTARALKFDVLREVEKELGRVRTEDRYAARPIDLDILLFGDLVCREDDLEVPDPDIRERPFLAVPLLELAPGLILPDTRSALADEAAARDRVGLEDQIAFTRMLRERLGL